MGFFESFQSNFNDLIQMGLYWKETAGYRELKEEQTNKARPAGTRQLGTFSLECSGSCDQAPSLPGSETVRSGFKFPGENLVCLLGLGVYSPVSQLCPGKWCPGPQTWPLGLKLGVSSYERKSCEPGRPPGESQQEIFEGREEGNRSALSPRVAPVMF